MQVRSHAIGGGQYDIGDHRGDGDRQNDEGGMGPIHTLRAKHHDGRDGTGAGEHGDAEGDDANVVLLGAFLGFPRRLADGRSLGAQHIETDHPQNEAASNTKGGKCDPKQPEDQAAGHGEDGKNDQTGSRGAQGHVTAAGAARAGSHYQEGRNGREGVHQNKDRGEGDKSELDERRQISLEPTSRV